jgi:hypothetical protein
MDGEINKKRRSYLPPFIFKVMKPIVVRCELGFYWKTQTQQPQGISNEF